MLKKLTPEEKIAIYLSQFGVKIRDAFLAAIADLKSRITLRLVVARLEAHDIEGAIRALNIEAPAFNGFLDAVAQAFTGGGNNTIEDMPTLRDPEGYRIVLRFDARDPVAEAWLSQHSATLVTEVTDDMKSAVRSVMMEGQVAGQGPLQTALDIVGRTNRTNRATGVREGGILGLTSQQAEYVASARRELLSGDPAMMRNYLTRNRRGRRFDKSIRAAIVEGKPISADAVKKIVDRYSDGLLELRGETIARTEGVTALSASSDEAMRQTIAAGHVDASLVDQKWHTNLDGRERPSHHAMNGQVQPWGQSFTSGAGVPLRYPGDPNAPASERVACRCARTFIIRKQPRTVH